MVRGGPCPAIPTRGVAKESPRRAASAPPAWPATWFVGKPVDELTVGGPEGADAWRLIVSEATRRDPVGALSVRKPRRVPNRVRDDVREILTVGGDGPVSDDLRDPGRKSYTPRRYLIAVRARGPAELACLPVPWDTGPNERLPIEVLVRREAAPGRGDDCYVAARCPHRVGARLHGNGQPAERPARLRPGKGPAIRKDDQPTRRGPEVTCSSQPSMKPASMNGTPG